jgi:hypothetical protein
VKYTITPQAVAITNVKRQTSGKGIAALFQRTWIIDVYAPSGAEKGMPGISTVAAYINYQQHVPHTEHKVDFSNLQ